ncbi:telomere-associated protein RIF1, partial [Nephila pilipes]
EPQYFEAVCSLLQNVLESIDFSSVGSSSTSGFGNGSLLMKKKKPLGNLTSFVDLLSFLLTCFYANYIEHEDDIYQSCTPKAQRKGHISKTAVPLDLLKTFFGNLKTGSVISSVLEELAVPLSKFFAITQKKANANIIGAKLEVLWNVVTSSIEIHYLGPYDTDFLTTMCPLLESSITHFRRHIKERSRRFWFATFAPVISSLTLPESFKNILKKSKLSLMPDENVSSLEDCMYNPASDSIEDEIVNFENVTSLKESSVKTSEVSKVNESKSTKEAESKVMKEKKLSINKNVDELSSSEFVKIDNPTYVSLTPRRRSFRNRKSFIPTMYNDLSQSQDTTLGGSSESFDTSSSCEIVEFKSLEECDKPLVASSKNGNFNEDAEKSVVSSKIIDLHDSTSSIEILTSMNGIVNSIEEALNLEEINAGKSEVVCENTFPLKTSSSLDTNKIDQNITNCAGSLDVIIVSSSDDISVQKIVIDSKSLNSDSINDVEKCNQDPISETDCKPNQTELKKKKRRLKRRNSNDDLKDSQEMAKMEESSLDNSAKKDSLISDYKFEKENGEPLLNPQGSQRTKKFKLHIESANKEQVLPKKNGKCKQSIITSHLKSISKTDDNKSHLESQNIKLSESLANESSSTNNNQSSISDIKKTCDEIVDLSDSEEIIPSSQSSVDSMSYVKFPALEKSPKRTLIFNNFDGEANLDLPSVKNNAEQKSDIQVEENSNECPETPIDLIETPCKGSISSEVFSQISSFSVAKTISSMPLKSSENLVNSNELLNKIDNNGIKTDLCSVILQKNEEKKDLKAENTPPLYTEAYNVQTSEPVLLQNAHTEEKIRSFAASKLLNVAVENDEDSPKTVRIKSLRSASKNTSRKSFSSAVKKTVKKPVKRKSMPNLNPLSKVEKLDTVEEGVTFEGLSKSDSLTLSNENVNQPETNSQFENKLQDKVSLISVSSSVTTDSEIEQNSILEDIADVISDIHEKLESYNDAYTCEFSLNMTAEVEQDSNKIGLTSCMDLATSEESLEKSNKEFREESIDASVIISGNNSNVNAVFENVVLKPVDENCINLSSAILKISENLEIEKSGSGLNYKENTEMSEEPSKDNCSLIHDMQKSETDIDDNCLKIVSLPVRSFEADEKDKLLIHVSEELNNIENKDSEMRSDIQSDQHFDKSFHECVLSIESKADEKEFNKTAVRKSIPSNNIESYEIVELSVQGEHDSIGNVFNAVSNIDQGSKALLSSYTQHNDIKNSSSGLLNGVVEETEQKIMNKEKFNYINSMEYSNQIDKDIGDSCCDEIKEIQETCEMDDNQNISANSRNLSLEGKRAPEISYPLSFLENDIVSTDVEIGKIDGNKEPFFSQAEDSKTGSICIENLVKKEREIKELDALESNSNVSVVHVDLKQSISIPTDDMHGAPVQCNVAACQEIAENENFANKAINVNCSSLPGTMVCTANSTSDFADKEIESSSRRRKAKCPVRSAFNFRHRSNVLVSMTKSFPKNNDQNTSKEVNDKNGKKTVHIIQKKLLENNNKKVKKFSDSKIHNDPSKVEDGDNLIQNSSNSSLDTVDVSKKPVTSTKRPKTILSYQEITDVNTRFNASMAPQTRRLKMLASSVHKSLPVQDDVYSLGENDITCMENENSISTSSSILKKRKASSDPGPSKHRKVTFADPLVEERLFRNDDNLSDRILKASILLNINDSEHDSSPQDIDKVTKVRDENTNVSVKPIPSTDDIPSSSEYQSSDENLTNYCNFPISPLLINCEESVCSILNELTTPTWAHGLVTLLFSKNIKTIGDLCKLNVHELRALPLKSPKVACLHNALITHLKRTQDATSEKLNSEDWCFGTDSTENKNSEIHTDVNWKGKTESEIFEGVAQELLCDDRIQKLSTETLIALSKKSFLEMTKRLEDV